MNNNIMLSVRLMTYNHSQYILECLKGIEKQETKFNLEVIIGDDFSTDNNIYQIKQFISSSKNNKINFVLLNRKKGDNYDMVRQQKGRLYNFSNIIQHCTGKYIALIDGDDYWNDPLKLQKQVDFLEQHANFNICFTRANTLKNNTLDLFKIPKINTEGIYTYDDLLEQHNFITTGSVVFRNNITTFPNWFYKIPFGDMGLYLLTCKTAKIKCLNEKMAIYRIHHQGIWSGIKEIKQYENYLLFYKLVFNELTIKQKNIIREKQKIKISRISYLKYKKNRLLRVLNRIILGLKYKL